MLKILVYAVWKVLVICNFFLNAFLIDNYFKIKTCPHGLSDGTIEFIEFLVSLILVINWNWDVKL